MGRRISELYPIIIGMNPPTKEVVLIRTMKQFPGGYACAIYHADFPKGTKRGESFAMTDQSVKRHSLAAWLQFKDSDAMRRFGQMLVDFADGDLKEGD